VDAGQNIQAGIGRSGAGAEEGGGREEEPDEEREAQKEEEGANGARKWGKEYGKGRSVSAVARMGTVWARRRRTTTGASRRGKSCVQVESEAELVAADREAARHG
jgi:hypothetical protein